jgi:hypothetical protein
MFAIGKFLENCGQPAIFDPCQLHFFLRDLNR